MAKLNQIIAVVNGKKTNVQKKLTELYKSLDKKDLFEGLTRNYKPLDEEGETFPPEEKGIILNTNSMLEQVSSLFRNLWDVVATQDITNCVAIADVKVDEKVVLAKVPVTTLLYLEKQLEDLNTFVNHLPTLNPAFKWEWDSNVNCYATKVERNNKTKKIPKVLVKYEATDFHPAQTEVYHEDVKIGEWELIRFSSAIPSQKKKEMLDRISQLREGVKFAREEANNIDVEQKEIADNILDFVIGTLNKV